MNAIKTNKNNTKIDEAFNTYKTDESSYNALITSVVQES